MREITSVGGRTSSSSLFAVAGIALLLLSALLFYLGRPFLTVQVKSASPGYVEIFSGASTASFDERVSTASYTNAGTVTILELPVRYGELGAIRWRISHAPDGLDLCDTALRRSLGSVHPVRLSVQSASVPVPDLARGTCVHVDSVTSGANVVDLAFHREDMKGWKKRGVRLFRASKVALGLGLVALLLGRAAVLRGTTRILEPLAVMQRWGARRWYLVFAVVFGVAFGVMRPPGSVPDELAHLTKAMAVADGFVVGSSPDGTMEPIRVALGPFDANWFDRGLRFSWAEVGRTFDRPLTCERQAGTNIAASSLGYSPLPYSVTAASFRMACSVDASFGAFYFVAILLNFALATFITYLAVRIAGSAQWIIAAIALLPINIFLASSLSSEPLTVSLGLLFVSAVWSIAARERQASNGMLALIVVCAWGVAFTKPGYVWVLPLALLCLPAWKRSRWHQALLACLAVVLPCFMHVWVAAETTRFSMPRATVVPAENIAALRADPVHIFRLWWDTFFSDNGWYLLRSAIGRMEWRDVTLSTPICLLAIAGLLIASIGSPRPVSSQGVPVIARLYALALAIAGICALTLPLYVTWTSVDAPFIQGLQGRYFLVALATIGVSLGGQKWRGTVADRWLGVMPFVWAITLGAGAVTLYSRYHGM